MSRRNRVVLLVFWILIMLMLSSRPAVISAQDSKVFEDSFVVFREKLESNNAFKLDLGLLTQSPRFLVRKAAHVFMYFGLCMLSISVWIRKEKRFNTYFKVLIFCVIYACLDEFYQTFIPGRTGLVTDVFIDSIGILLSVSFTSIIIEFGYRKKWKTIMNVLTS